MKIYIFVKKKKILQIIIMSTWPKTQSQSEQNVKNLVLQKDTAGTRTHWFPETSQYNRLLRQYLNVVN